MIHWVLLGEAMKFYQNRNYRYVEVPWIVQNVMNMITCPDERYLTKIAGTTTSLVGSAEQGFLSMQMNGMLPPGSYVTCSPCFRNDHVDALHRPYFMKVELYKTDDTSIDAMYSVIQDAEDFFHSVYSNDGGATKIKPITRVDTHEGIDINLNGIEIGSYGLRSFSSHKWICGTGLALPRFSQALQSWKLNEK